MISLGTCLAQILLLRSNGEMIRIKHFELRKTIDDILQIYDYDTVVNRTLPSLHEIMLKVPLRAF